MTEQTVWHKLSAKDKPMPLEYLLVETNTYHYPFRICIYYEGDYEYFRDAYKTSYFFPRWSNAPNSMKRSNDFTIKRWAYLKDIK